MTTATVPRDSGDAGAIGRVAGNAALLAASRIVSAGAIFGWQIALARVLGAHDYGLYGSIAALMGIGAALVDPGVQIILVRDVARRPALRGRYLTAAAATHVVLALAVYAALQIVARAGAYDARIATLLLLVGFNLAFDSLGTLAMNQFIAAERMRWPSVGSAVHALVLVGLGAGGVLLGGRLWWVYVAVAITSAGRMVGFFAAAARQGWRIERPLDRALARAILSAGLP
ncbi:MAG TPA: oligosaccharide flippase family protein, partial [Gemmatimonadaceae bacterium]